MIYLPPLSKLWIIKVNGLKVTYIRRLLKSCSLAYILISLMKKYLVTEATFRNFQNLTYGEGFGGSSLADFFFVIPYF